MNSTGLNKVRVDFENGIAVLYGCDYLLSNGNTFKQVVIPSYYDLIYPCSGKASDARQFVRSSLLDRAATTWGILPSGQACTVPTTLNGNWLVAVSSLPHDSLVSNLECQRLEPGVGQCCVVIENQMTFTPQGGYNADNLMVYVAQQLDLSSFTEGSLYQTRFIGSKLDINPEAAKTNIPAPINVAQTAPPKEPKERVTVLGGFVVGALLAVLVTISAVVVRRRRKRFRNADINAALSQSDVECNVPKSGGSDASGGPTIELEVLSDGGSPDHLRVDSFDTHDDDREPPHHGSYTFDLGNSFKNEIMGTHAGRRSHPPRHGPTSMTVVPPYPMEETSDSEVDSWAQTDGTVGSLEERLDDITAEI